MLGDRLSEFESRLREQGAAVIDRLVQPGLPAADVRRALLESCGHAPEELVIWFCWQNGVRDPSAPDVPERGALIGAWVPWSLEGAIDYSTKLQDWLASAGGWPRSWLPIVRQHDRRLTAESASDPVRAPIIRTGLHGEPDRKVADSLEQLVAAWLRLLDSGVYWDREGETWNQRGDRQSIPVEAWRAAGYR